MDFEKELKIMEKKEEEKRLAFLKKGADKIRDNDDLIYRLMALQLSQRFEIPLNWRNEPEDVVYPILNFYIKNIEKDWEEWLWSNDAPMIKKIGEAKRIFPELYAITNDNEEIIKMANSLYGLDIKTDYDGFDVEYMYAFSFDFNSFTPIKVDEIKKLKEEKEVLAKYGHDTSEIDKRLDEFGLTEDEMEVL